MERVKQAANAMGIGLILILTALLVGACVEVGTGIDTLTDADYGAAVTDAEVGCIDDCTTPVTVGGEQ